MIFRKKKEKPKPPKTIVIEDIKYRDMSEILNAMVQMLEVAGYIGEMSAWVSSDGHEYCSLKETGEWWSHEKGSDEWVYSYFDKNMKRKTKVLKGVNVVNG